MKICMTHFYIVPSWVLLESLLIDIFIIHILINYAINEKNWLSFYINDEFN